jgi:hypothetical protein
MRVRALPAIGGPAVEAFRACDGCGWQNGNWLLMSRVNLLVPVESPESRPVVQRVADPDRCALWACSGA